MKCWMSEREEIAHLLKGSRRFYSAYLHLLLGGKKIEDKWKQDLSVRDWLKGTHHLDAKGNGHRTCNSDQDCDVFSFWLDPTYVIENFSGNKTSDSHQLVVVCAVKGHFNPGLFNPKLQLWTFQLQTFQPSDSKIHGSKVCDWKIHD